MVNFDGIPDELKTLRAWVLWKYEEKDGSDKPTKVPYCATTGYRASPIDPFHWCTYTDVCNKYKQGGYDGIGFVLSQQDPYTVIDLDPKSETESKICYDIYAASTSYVEISPSGTGLHVWVKAQIPRGRKKHPVEMYSTGRFITVTGNVLWDLPIEYRQAYVDNEYAKMPTDVDGKFTGYDGLDTPAGTDQEIVDKASSAKNGEKFVNLWNGVFHQYYNSQSEADFALIDILAFYTQNSEQIVRLFRFSELGKREKAQRHDFVERMVRKSFDKLPPRHVMENMAESMDEVLQNMLNKQQEEAVLAMTNTQNIPSAPPTREQKETANIDVGGMIYSDEVTFPAGLVGEIAEYLYEAAPRPVKEIALAGALGVVAGIAGSAYNVSATGLNMYICVLANTGTGKDALGKPLSRMLENVRALSPSSEMFFSAGDFASSQGLLNHLSGTSRCFMASIGECGMWLSNLSNPNAHEKHVSLRRVLLDLYGKSGKGSVIRPTVYADKTKNTNPIRNPAVTLLGDSTQEKFFQLIDESLIAEGFIPRWLIIEYKGGRPKNNKQHHLITPDPFMVSRIAELSNYSHKLMESYNAIEVAIPAEVEKLSDELDIFCDAQYESVTADALRNLWTRVHLKALKVAAIIAVGRNPINPVMSVEDFEFGKSLCLRDTYAMCARFTSGLLIANVAFAENAQRDALCRALAVYVRSNDTALTKYGVTERMKVDMTIPYTFLQRRCASLSVFAKDKRGTTTALRRAIMDMVSSGLLYPLPKSTTATKYNSGAEMWTVSDLTQLADYL